MSLLALQISKDRLVQSVLTTSIDVENDNHPSWWLCETSGGEGRGRCEARAGTGKLMERHVEQSRRTKAVLEGRSLESGSRKSTQPCINPWMACAWKKRADGHPASPLEKRLVKLIRAKWGLNGVGIDRAAGFCTTGTSRMFDHPEPYNYRVE